MNNLQLVLNYSFKIKTREMKAMLKNYFTVLVVIFIVVSYLIFYFSKVFIENLETIRLYSNYIFLGISIIMALIILLKKKIPLEWHPASIIYLSRSKLQTIIKVSLLKKLVAYISLSISITSIIQNVTLDFQTIQMFLSFLNLFIISLTSRYYIYNKGFDFKILSFIFSYIILLNFQLYSTKYLTIALIISLSCLSILNLKKILNTNFNFNKTFNDMVFINRIEAIARGKNIHNMQKITRETLSEKNRKNNIVKNIKFKNPLNNKNLITFSRLNLNIIIYVFFILIILIALYKLEIFEFVKTIKELGVGLIIIALYLTAFIKNIFDLIIDQKNLLIEKSKEGLYLPYKKHKIRNSFIFLGLPISLFITVFVGIIFMQNIWIILISFFLYLIILLLSLSFEKKKGSDFFATFIYFLIFGVSCLLIGLS